MRAHSHAKASYGGGSRVKNEKGKDAQIHGGLVLLKFQGLLLHVGSVFFVCQRTRSNFSLTATLKFLPREHSKRESRKTTTRSSRCGVGWGGTKKTLERGLFPLWLLPVLFSGGAPARPQGGGNARKKRFLLRLSFPLSPKKEEELYPGEGRGKKKSKTQKFRTKRGVHKKLFWLNCQLETALS